MPTPVLDFRDLNAEQRVRLITQLRASLDPIDEPSLPPGPGLVAALDGLRASEARYRRLFESAKDGILILDASTGLIVDVNPFLLDLLGYSRETMLDKHVWELGFLRDIVGNRANFEELSRNDYIRYEDKALETREGRRIEVEFVSNVYLVDGHRVIQCNIRDISERVAAAGRLKAARRLTEEILDALPVRVFWKDLHGVFLGCNLAVAHDAGLISPSEVVGKTDHEMPWREQAQEYREADSRVAESGESQLLIEEEQTTPDGQIITLLTNKVPLRDAHGVIFGVLGTYMDVSDLRRAEASEALLAMAVQHAAEAIVITDGSGTILDVNPAFERSTGYTRLEAIGQNPRLLQSGRHDAAFYRRMWAVLGRGDVWRGQLINKRKDGSLFTEEATISPMRGSTGQIVSFVAVKRDISRQEQLEAQLRRAQRLESIGTLAGGVAHDLNNALAPVLMATELLRLELPASAAEGLDLIESGARRGAELVRQLLTFASGVEGQRVPVALEPLCQELERMLRYSFPKNIVLRMGLPADLPAVLGDPTQIYQVLLNLFLNARDAMPDGGELALDAGLAEVKSLSDVPAIDVPPGWYVRLRVTDTGSGIAPETLDRIFDPFFTTKPPEQGTGLGLATSLGIVRAHGGSIRAYSEVGQGATFSVFLPVAPGDPAAADPPTQLPSAVVGDGKTILVVDDEASVRDILRRVLVRMHFTVVTASDGTSAMRELKEHVVGFDAVITDLHMPGLDGISFVRLVRGRSPETGIIVVSGLVAAPQRQQLKGLGVHTVLSKPFTHAELMTALQTVFAS